MLDQDLREALRLINLVLGMSVDADDGFYVKKLDPVDLERLIEARDILERNQ